jgi:hypothetical protein
MYKNLPYSLISTSLLAQDLNETLTYMPGNFSHINRIAPVDSHGNLRDCFDGLNHDSAAAMIEEINRLQE